MSSHWRKLPDARICEIIQGVEFWVQLSTANRAGGPDAFRAVIAAEALREAFQAGLTQQSWLEAFNAHRVAIEQRAKEIYAAAGQPSFVAIADAKGAGAGPTRSGAATHA